MKLTIPITPELRVRLLHAQNIEIEVPDTAVPEGWQLVPALPTSEMCDAFHRADNEWEDGWAWDDNGNRHWSPVYQWVAMLAAAPNPEGGDS